jgi:hypothetical protein
MLQGHVFDSFLSLSIKSEGWFYTHTFVHGFTSPIFLVSSGLAFGVATFRKWEIHTVWTSAIMKRVRRYLLLLAIGYWLHLAYYSLKFMLTKLTPEQYNYLFQVDALQIIGVTLLGCQGLVYHAKSLKWYVSVILAVIAIITVSTPYLWALDKSQWFIGITAYIDKSTGSYFPIFPWSIYLLSGTLISYLFIRWRDVDPKKVAMRISLIGFVSFIIGKAGIEKWITPYGTGSNLEDYGTFVFLVYHNLGVICIFIAILYLIDCLFIQTNHDLVHHSKVIKRISTIGQETLVIYIVHLFIVYGSPLNKALLAQYRGFLNVPLAIVYFIFLAIFMYFFAINWHKFKREKPETFKRFQYIGTGLLLTLFVINNWLLSII